MSLLTKNLLQTLKTLHTINKLPQLINKSTTMNISSCKLEFSDYGEPEKVLQLLREDLPEPTDNEVLVRMLASPINPADINLIQGKYPVKIQLPQAAGNEGVGEITSIGSKVRDLQPGDRVIPFKSNLGTWRTHGIFHENSLFKVPKNLGIVEASTFTVNPCTAYRMLNDFVQLTPGDTVIQNGANSACGQNVIQLCHAYGYKSVNIVRNRPDIDSLKAFLTELGADYVLTEEEVRTTKLFKETQKPKLALNCVGGKNALDMMRCLDNGGVMVTYGGMSREPVTVPTSALIFKNIHVLGFWMSRWTLENEEANERFAMFNELIGLMCAGKLKAPAHEMVPFMDYKQAFGKSMKIEGFAGKKFILDMQ